MERGLIKHFYKRPHADQILVTFGLAIVLQEVIKYFYGANPIPTPAPQAFTGSFDFGACFGFDPNLIIYPYWRIIYFCFAAIIIGAVFAFLQFTTFGMVVRAGMADRETVGLLGINIDRRFTIMFGTRRCRRGPCRGHVHADQLTQLPHGHGLPGSQLRGGGCRRHGLACPARCWQASCWAFWKALPRCAKFSTILPGINQIIIYLVAIIILLTRPRGLMGRKGVMEE